MPVTSEQRKIVSDAILGEILGVMGVRKRRWARPVVGAVFRKPIDRITEILVEFDQQIDESGWYSAVKNFAAHFIKNVHVIGLENLPPTGGLIVASNHPGAYDVIALASCIPRDDLKIFSSELGFVKSLAHVQEHFIAITSDVSRRMTSVREALRHLRSGGAVLIFPRGQVEPDLAVWPGSLPDFDRWYTSMDVLIRKAPETQTIAAIASGVLSKRWFDHPVPRLQKRIEQRQKVAEIFQVAEFIRSSAAPSVEPLISFSEPVDFSEAKVQQPADGAYMEAIIRTAMALLPEHSTKNAGVEERVIHGDPV